MIIFVCLFNEPILIHAEQLQINKGLNFGHCPASPQPPTPPIWALVGHFNKYVQKKLKNNCLTKLWWGLAPPPSNWRNFNDAPKIYGHGLPPLPPFWAISRFKPFFI